MKHEAIHSHMSIHKESESEGYLQFAGFIFLFPL